MTLKIDINMPKAEAYLSLRNTAGWGKIGLNQTRQALENSLFGACIYENKELIGMARVIGDGVFNVYIQDVVVKHDYQRQGLGRDMLSRLIAHMKTRLPAHCTVGLMAAENQYGFYTRFGFNRRPCAGFGPGMSAALKSLSS